MNTGYGTTGYGTGAGYGYGYGTGVGGAYGGGYGMYAPQAWVPFLHFDPDEFILFEFWHTTTPLGMFLSCIIIGAIASIFEAIRAFRVLYRQRRTDAVVAVAAAAPTEVQQAEAAQNNNDGGGGGAVMVGGLKAAVGQMKRVRLLPVGVDLGLYGLQLLAGYLVMLAVVMTLNGWILLSVLMGHLSSKLVVALVERALIGGGNT